MSRYWLLKSEPESYSLSHLKSEGTAPWTGVRGYQARNNMMEMSAGDLAFFYHSSIPQPAAVGICKIVRAAYPDFTQFDRESEYYDGRAKAEKPIWRMVDVEYVETFPHPVTLARMRAEPRLLGMELLKKGQRLSVQSVTPQEWDWIRTMASAVH